MTDPLATHPQRRHPLPHPRHVAPTHPLLWLAAGWRTFIAQPGVWALQTLTLIAALFVLTLILGLIPTYGPLLAPLALQTLFPMLFAGMISGAHAVARGETLTVGQLFDGIRRHPGNLLMVGFFFVASGLLAALFALVIGGSAALTGTIVGALSEIGFATSTTLLSLAIWPVLLILLLMGLWFAPALVMLQNVSPLDAIRQSLRACFASLPSFLILGMSLYGLVFVAMLPAALGIFVLVPVIAGALHAAWEDVFAPRADAEPPALRAPATDEPVPGSDTPSAEI